MKNSINNATNASKIVFKANVENMNSLQILEYSFNTYSYMSFYTGENVIKICASIYVKKEFGTLETFYNKLNILTK